MVDEAELASLPASAQRVFRCIREQGPVSHDDIWRATHIPPRTIRYAIRRLREKKMAAGRLRLQDSRTCHFFVHPRLIDPSFIERQEADSEAHRERCSISVRGGSTFHL